MADTNALNPSRQGTWQFISTAQLMNPDGAHHDLCDELESALHVLLYTSVRHRASHLPVEECEVLKKACIEHFDSRSNTVQRQASGGHGKIQFFLPSGCIAFSQESLEMFLSEPHASLVEMIRRLFIPLYTTARQLKLFPSMEQSRDSALEVLKTSDRFIEIIEEHLGMDGWNENDVSDALDGLHGPGGGFPAQQSTWPGIRGTA